MLKADKLKIRSIPHHFTCFIWIRSLQIT